MVFVGRGRQAGCDPVMNRPAGLDYESRLRIAIQDIGGVFAGALQDLEKMKRWHSPSKRGMNYQHAMDSLEARLRTGEAAYQEVLQKMRETPDGNG